MALNSQMLYENSGNANILKFLELTDQVILDIGCGAGNLAQGIYTVYPTAHITGITCSRLEYERARSRLNQCFCLDIERELLPELVQQSYDVLIFSHVLEHLVDPTAVIQKFLPFLKVGGKVVIALPNIANWRERWKLALGRFEYTESGVMDKTHLHFYTFHTAPQHLVMPVPQLHLEEHTVVGSVPLAFLRHSILSEQLRQAIDRFGCRCMPNLFGGEILIKAVKL
jgi:2-polyprenyl-3-methyl-5-hydroxy-6-metoxy-1,4-benzoquinol methylase